MNILFYQSHPLTFYILMASTESWWLLIYSVGENHLRLNACRTQVQCSRQINITSIEWSIIIKNNIIYCHGTRINIYWPSKHLNLMWCTLWVFHFCTHHGLALFPIKAHWTKKLFSSTKSILKHIIIWSIPFDSFYSIALFVFLDSRIMW